MLTKSPIRRDVEAAAPISLSLSPARQQYSASYTMHTKLLLIPCCMASSRLDVAEYQHSASLVGLQRSCPETCNKVSMELGVLHQLEQGSSPLLLPTAVATILVVTLSSGTLSSFVTVPKMDSATPTAASSLEPAHPHLMLEELTPYASIARSPGSPKES